MDGWMNNKTHMKRQKRLSEPSICGARQLTRCTRLSGSRACERYARCGSVVTTQPLGGPEGGGSVFFHSNFSSSMRLRTKKGGQRTYRPGRAAGRPCLKASTQHSALSTQHSALSTQHSALSTQHSALSTQHSALSTQHSALSTQHSALSTQHSGFEGVWRGDDERDDHFSECGKGGLGARGVFG